MKIEQTMLPLSEVRTIKASKLIIFHAYLSRLCTRHLLYEANNFPTSCIKQHISTIYTAPLTLWLFASLCLALPGVSLQRWPSCPPVAS